MKQTYDKTKKIILIIISILISAVILISFIPKASGRTVDLNTETLKITPNDESLQKVKTDFTYTAQPTMGYFYSFGTSPTYFKFNFESAVSYNKLLAIKIEIPSENFPITGVVSYIAFYDLTNTERIRLPYTHDNTTAGIITFNLKSGTTLTTGVKSIGIYSETNKGPFLFSKFIVEFVGGEKYDKGSLTEQTPHGGVDETLYGEQLPYLYATCVSNGQTSGKSFDDTPPYYNLEKGSYTTDKFTESDGEIKFSFPNLSIIKNTYLKIRGLEIGEDTEYLDLKLNLVTNYGGSE